jgi:hypothetical protein
VNERARKTPVRTAEATILREALRAFEAVTGVPATGVKEHVHLPEGEADAVFQVADEKRLVAEIKRTLTPATLGHLAARLERFPRPRLLVTSYVTPPMAERLRERDIAFIDTCGNAYLRLPNMLIYVTGRKPQTPPPRDTRVRAFRPSGLRVIFALLCRPDLAAAPYRDIAAAAGVALGTVNRVYFDLRRLGYLRETKARGRIIENRTHLLDKWVEAYASELRPKLTPRRFRIAKADWWKTEDLTALEMWLGGEPAAAVLTKHLRPEIVTIYGDTHLATLARTVQALKDDHGKLEVLHKFWNFETPGLDRKFPVVPPLLIYADLVATADARNLETAHIIRERFLAQA